MDIEELLDENGRPYVVVGGRRFVLADGEPMEAGDVDYDGPLPEIFDRLDAPPRNVSLAAKIVLLLSNGQAPLFGWLFACFGMIFCIVFLPMVFSSVLDLRYRNFSPAGQGEVVSVDHSVMKVNDRDVHKIVFKDADGNTASCYSHQEFQVGEKVGLEKSGNRTKIEGTRLSVAGGITGLFGAFVILFPIIGLWIVLHGTLQGLKAIHVLRDGEIGRGRFVGMEPTGTEINGRAVMKLNYRFKADDGQFYDAHANSLDTKRLTDDPVEPLLYDPLDPTRSVLLDGLPGKVQYDEMIRTFKTNPLRTVLPLFFCLLFFVELASLVYVLAGGRLIEIG